jgi:hypothetical protein
METKDQMPIPPEIIAVIAAAIAVTIEKPHRILHVRHAAFPVPYFNVWAFEGRVQLAASHRIR